MPRLSESQRCQAIAMLRAGSSIANVERAFKITRKTIYLTQHRQNATGTQRGGPKRLGHRKTTAGEDRHIRILHLRIRFLRLQIRQEMN